MNSQSTQNLALIALLVVAGAVSWTFQLREPLSVDTGPLASLPPQVLGWHGRDIPLEGTVEEMLRADDHVQRRYFDPAGGLVWLYIGYYGTERGGRSEHEPWECYPTAGWEIVEANTTKLPVGEEQVIQEILVQRGGEARLVHFWYRTSRSDHVVGELAHAWDRFVGRLTVGRADGAFVRLSTPLRGESVQSGRARLRAFGKGLAPQLAAHWPQETGAAAGSAIDG